MTARWPTQACIEEQHTGRAFRPCLGRRSGPIDVSYLRRQSAAFFRRWIPYKLSPESTQGYQRTSRYSAGILPVDSTQASLSSSRRSISAPASAHRCSHASTRPNPSHPSAPSAADRAPPSPAPDARLRHRLPQSRTPPRQGCRRSVRPAPVHPPLQSRRAR